MSKIGFVFFLILVNNSGIVAQTTSELSLPTQSEGAIHFDVSEITAEKALKLSYDFLAVFVATETNEYTSTIPVQGSYSIVKNKLIFKPYFPFEKGLPYIVRLNNIKGNEVSYTPFQIGEKEKVEDAKVVSIFPSAKMLPENVLRFYIYFQTPMKQEEALKHIKLINDSGNVDEHAFMKFKEELWSSDGKRLTLLFDPGRIKRGVSTNIRQGPALENGHQYYLNISSEWKDIYGQNLIKDTLKEISVVQAYRKKMNVGEWTTNNLKVNSLDPLMIDFGRIIDHALIQSMIQIIDDTGRLIKGTWEIQYNEKQVQFVPQNKWERGHYKIQFDTHFEDVSGNNLQNLLDHRMESQGINKKHEFIAFTIL